MTYRWMASLVLGLVSTTAFGEWSAPVRNLNLPKVSNELLIGQKPGATSAQIESLVRRLQAQVVDRFQSSPTILIRFAKNTDGLTLQAYAEQFAELPSVRFVEANSIVRANAVNDPRFAEQYGLKNTGQSSGVAGFDIDAETAWTHTKGDRSVLVAVVDTGIDYEHPDLKANIWTNPGEAGLDPQGKDKRTNGIDDDSNGFVDDFRGWDFAGNDNDPRDDNGFSHGTHCSGVIGAETNNGVGIAGINWQVSLVAVKFLDAQGSGTLANAIKAIDYGTMIGAKISSNSWGGGGYSEPLEASIANAEKHGELFIAAAGNDGVDTDDTPHYPSAHTNPNIIAVAAIDRSGKLADFSNYGRHSVDIAAPGVDILSTIKSGEYATLSGTSMATPHVSGVAALIWAKHPKLTWMEVKNRILNSAFHTDSVNAKTLTNGRLNAAAAVEEDVVAPSAVTQASVVDSARQTLAAQWKKAGDDGEVGSAHAYEVRYAAEPIIDELAWVRASQVDIDTSVDPATPDIVKAQLVGFGFNDTGYLAIRGRDNVGNLGALGDPVPFAMQGVEVIGKYRPEHEEEVTLSGAWGTEEVEGRHAKVFSDSPTGKYVSNIDAAILLPVMKTSGTGYAIAFDTAADLERGYDFGRLEIQKDGTGSWTLIKRFTDKYDWKSIYLPIDTFLAGSKSFQLRFRMTSDKDIEEQGWFLDDITIIKDE